MEVYEKINYLITEKKITKQDFIKNLIALEPSAPADLFVHSAGQTFVQLQLKNL